MGTKGRVCKVRTINCTCGKELSLRGLKNHIIDEHIFTDYNIEYYNIMYKSLDIFNIIKDYNDGNSISFLNNKYNLKTHDIHFIFQMNDIKRRSNSESKQTNKYKEKITTTIQEKYGVDNISQSDTIKQKKKNTMLQNYGYINNFCNSDIHKKALNNIDYEKSYETMLITLQEKYGVNNVSQIPGIGNKIGLTKHQNYNLFWSEYKKEINNKILEEARKLIKHTNISKLEIRIHEILNDLNISYTANKFIHGNNFDLIFDNKIILEINGDYWHANPIKYKKNDLIKYPGNNFKTAFQIWERDRIKKEKVENKGYKVHYIWESHLKSMSDSNIIEFIFNILK